MEPCHIPTLSGLGRDPRTGKLSVNLTDFSDVVDNSSEVMKRLLNKKYVRAQTGDKIYLNEKITRDYIDFDGDKLKSKKRQ